MKFERAEEVEKTKEGELSTVKGYFIHSSMALHSSVGPWPILQLRKHFYTDGRTPWTRDHPVARPLPTHRRTQRINANAHYALVGLEPTIPAFNGAKTVHALERAVTVIGVMSYTTYLSLK
jgi:hypothetical protein